MLTPDPTADALPTSACPRLRLLVWKILVWVMLVGTGGWLIAARGDLVLAAPIRLYVGWGGLGTVILLIAALLATTPADAIRLSQRTSERIILLGTLLIHVPCLVLTWPALSDDVARYRFDGRQWLHGLNAYRQTPAEQALTADADFLDRLVPHATAHTAYLPTSQLYFAAVAAIDSAVNPTPVEPTAASWRPALRELSWLDRAGIWRSASCSMVLLCALLLLRLLRSLERSPWWSVLFLWHPLVVMEVTGNGHQDIVGISLCLTSVLTFRSGRPTASAGALALSAFVKPVALAFVLIGRSPTATTAHRRFIGTLAVAGAALLLLTLLLGGDELAGAWRRYSRTWEFNGPLFDAAKCLLIEGLGSEPDTTKQRIRQTFGLILIGGFAWCAWRRHDGLNAAVVLLVMACLLSPVLYPWYLLWPLALVATGASWARWTVLTWCATSVFSYSVLHEPVWLLPRWAMVAQFAPVALASLLDGSRALRARQTGG